MKQQYHRFDSFSEKHHVILIIYGKEMESKGKEWVKRLAVQFQFLSKQFKS